MGKEHVAQLKHRDPEKRKTAIHHVAKDLNRDALKQLARMCEDDPDAEVRTLARKAGVYMRQKLGELPVEASDTAEKSDKPGKPSKIAVSEDEVKRAQAILNTALNYQMENENARAMKYLAQALKVDPNLRHDPFFLNVLHGVMGEDGEEAIRKITDTTLQKSTGDKESRQKLQKQIDEHNQEIKKATWTDVGFDFGLLVITLLIGMTLVFYVGTEIARGYVAKVEANRLMVAEAKAAGRVVDAEAETLVYLSLERDSTNLPKQFTELVPDTALWTVANQLKPLTLVDLLPVSLIGTLAATLVIFLTTLGGHVLSQKLLKGVGRLPYFAHRTSTLLLSRGILLLILCGVGTVIVFETNGGTFTLIVSGILALFSLFAIFKLISITSKSYHFGLIQGVIAMLPGLLLLGMLSAFIIL